MNIAGQTTQLNILDSKLLRGALVAMATEIIFITRFWVTTINFPGCSKSTPICKTTYKEGCYYTPCYLGNPLQKRHNYEKHFYVAFCIQDICHVSSNTISQHTLHTKCHTDSALLVHSTASAYKTDRISSNCVAATHNTTHSPCTSTCTTHPVLPTHCFPPPSYAHN